MLLKQSSFGIEQSKGQVKRTRRPILEFVWADRSLCPVGRAALGRKRPKRDDLRREEMGRYRKRVHEKMVQIGKGVALGKTDWEAKKVLRKVFHRKAKGHEDLWRRKKPK